MTKSIKKISSSLLATLLLAVLPSLQVAAAPQTVLLEPTSATLGMTKIYVDGSPTPDIVVGGGGTDLNNVLVEDGQFTLLDPELPGPGNAVPNPNTVLFLDYEKNAICTGAVIQAVNVHSIWKAGAESTQQNDLAILIKTDDFDSTPNFSVAINSTNGEFNIINQVFGGIVADSGIPGGTFSGNASTTLTHDSSAVQNLPTSADLKDLSTRLVVGMGDGYTPEGEIDPLFVTGLVDHAYLEVTYDDSNCSPEGVDTAVVASPKTGSVLTASIIAAALVASIGASLFGVKRTKLKHRVSERE